jgi:1,2-diacylglycerol 3-beta-galactosyltransferase
MTHKPNKSPHILFLFSDTGGGHRSAAEAIIESLQLEYGDRLCTSMVDFFKEYAPQPLDRMPELYPRMVRSPRAWSLGFYLSNGQRRGRLITATTWPYVRRRAKALVSQHPCDLVVSVHPLANAPILHAFGKSRPPFITVVTDLVTTHALWFHRKVDLCVVPTELAYQRALAQGMSPAKIRVIGIPVADRFCRQIETSTKDLRQRLGWPVNLPVVLLVGGSEGMGPLERTARAIASVDLPAALIIVAGRNESLKNSLEGYDWQIPTLIYGFVHEMPNFMRAADIMVTKAGPSTISEAFIAGLPLILYSRVPGQEDGNVTYVTSEGAGVWAPNPDQLISSIRNWLLNPVERKSAADKSRLLARPLAARQIAHLIAEELGM